MSPAGAAAASAGLPSAGFVSAAAGDGVASAVFDLSGALSSAPVVSEGADGASDFFSGSGAAAGVAGAIGDDSAGAAGGVVSDFLSTGAGVAAGAGSAGAGVAAGAGADVEAAGAGVSSDFFFSQAAKPATAQVMTATASTLPNLFTCFLFVMPK
jgi:hypothetical protein